MELSQIRKKDRPRIAMRICDIASRLGATSTWAPIMDNACDVVRVQIETPSGLCATLSLAREHGSAYLIHWYASLGADFRFSALAERLFGSVNLSHRQKATDSMHSVDGVCTQIADILQSANSGALFEERPADQLRHARNALRGIISECELLQANTRPAVNLARIVSLAQDALKGAQ